MTLNYTDILTAHGLDRLPEAETTALAFFHELHNTLFDAGSPFNQATSRIITDPDNINEMVRCELHVLPGVDAQSAGLYVMSKWHDSLCYVTPVVEIIQRSCGPTHQRIDILTLSQGSGCSLTFIIQPG